VRIHKAGDIQYITFDNITSAGFATHAFSTRIGGVSQGVYRGMNLGLSRGDSREAVLENYSRFSEAVGFDWRSVVFSNQVHSSNVYRAGVADMGNGILRESKIWDMDALITNEPGVTLQTFHADCVPVFLADPIKRAVGLVHAGWMGTLKEISRICLERMATEFGTKPGDVLVGIGPSIGPYSFETDDDVADRFKQELGFSCDFLYQSGHKFLIDLWGINRTSLERAGVKSHNIEDSYLCTLKHPEMFFSHRKMGNARGTMAAFISISV